MQKRLTKSRSNVVLTGTLAGIAEYFGIDPTIVRVIYVFLCLSGAPLLLYPILAVLIPAGPKTNSYGHNNPYYGRNTSQKKPKTKERKHAEPVDDDDWSDF